MTMFTFARSAKATASLMSCSRLTETISGSLRSTTGTSASSASSIVSSGAGLGIGARAVEHRIDFVQPAIALAADVLVGASAARRRRAAAAASAAPAAAGESREVEDDPGVRPQRRFLPRPAVEIHDRAFRRRMIPPPGATPTVVMPFARATGIASLSA